jgi:hypothetical protein
VDLPLVARRGERAAVRAEGERGVLLASDRASAMTVVQANVTRGSFVDI